MNSSSVLANIAASKLTDEHGATAEKGCDFDRSPALTRNRRFRQRHLSELQISPLTEKLRRRF